VAGIARGTAGRGTRQGLISASAGEARDKRGYFVNPRLCRGRPCPLPRQWLCNILRRLFGNGSDFTPIARKCSEGHPVPVLRKQFVNSQECTFFDPHGRTNQAVWVEVSGISSGESGRNLGLQTGITSLKRSPRSSSTSLFDFPEPSTLLGSPSPPPTGCKAVSPFSLLVGRLLRPNSVELKSLFEPQRLVFG
jgi:hypothetical protein